MKTDLVTGRNVPDETKRVPLLTYPNARPAAWITKERPRVDFIVGNPPFLGTSRMRQDLGDGYAEALRAAYPEVPESADFVMYWWHKAAALVRAGAVRRFGLITTNSLRQTFNRRIVEHHLSGTVSRDAAATPPSPEGSRKLAGGGASRRAGTTGPHATTHRAPAGAPEDSTAPAGADSTGGADSGGSRFASPPANFPQPSGLAGAAASAAGVPLSLVFAVPDHPWVDTAEGAAVRIAMTVGAAGEHPGELRTATAEEPHDDGSSVVTFAAQTGRISADLTTGSDVSGAVELKANDGLSCPGMKLHGSGFIVTREEAKAFGLGSVAGLEQHIREYRNGRDLTDSARDVLCIDLFGLTAEKVRHDFPAVYQHVLTTVKPERDANQRETYRRNWWIFGEPRRDLRPALAGLARYIATVETAKHRAFQFLDATVLPDNRLIVIALDDAFHLGVLSSRIHVVFALAAGGTLEDRPVYNKSRCFDPFPFPACDEAAKARIRALGEELDAHRKRVQAQHPGLSLTAMYNVLEALRAGRALSAKETATHDAGLVSVLRQLHDELDAAVATAYGWLRDGRPETDLTDAEILTRLVALNATRAAEEAAGQIRYLRPEYQRMKGEGGGMKEEQTRLGLPASAPLHPSSLRLPPSKTPWPKPLAERVAAVERALAVAASPVTPAQLAKRFLRAKPADLAEILETLATLGRAHRDGENYTV
jgi:hypothetical protein